MPRNILIDPQRLGTGRPSIQFSGSIDNQVKLEVADLGDLNFKNDVSGNSILFVSGSGFVGVGTTNNAVTAYAFGVRSAVNSNIGVRTISSIGGSGTGAGFDSLTDAGGVQSFGMRAATYQFLVAPTQISLYIASGGNVGIGSTTTVSARLLVSGSSTPSTPTAIIKEGVVSPTGGAGTFDVQNSAGTSLFFVSGSGNVGIFTTPKPWSSSGTILKALQIAAAPSIASHATAANFYIQGNGYYDGAWKYTVSSTASSLWLIGNEMWFQRAPSGTADGSLTWSRSMTIDASGNITPGADSTQEFGTNALRWKNVVSSALSGSLTRLSDGTTPYLLAGTNVTITTGSNGQITINSSAAAGSVTGNGTLNYVPRWSSASTIDNSVIAQSSTSIGINVAPASIGRTLHVYTATGNNGVRIETGGNTASDYSVLQLTQANSEKAVLYTNLENTFLKATTGNLVLQGSSGGGAIIDSSGNAGIGVNSWTGRLFVSGTSTGTTPTLVVQHGVANGSNLPVLDVRNSAGTSLFFVSGSGRTGIGTTPNATIANARLEVNGSVIPTTHLNTSYNLGEPGRYWGITYTNDLYAYNSNTNSIAATGGIFQVAGPVEYSLYASTTNRVGVGAIAVSSVRLVVSGTTTGSDTTLRVRHGVSNGSNLSVLDVQNSAGTSLFFVSGSGNVGIGTDTPRNSLTIGSVGSIGSTIDSTSRVFISQASSTYGLTVYNAGATIGQNAGRLAFGAQQSGGVGVPYAQIAGVISDATLGANSGNLTLSVANAGTLVSALTIQNNRDTVFSGSVNPDLDLQQDLGTTTKRWRNVYANNISGSLTGSNVSAGQVVVAGTGGVLSGTNAFVWDNSNTRVGVGTAAPAYTLDLNVPAASLKIGTAVPGGGNLLFSNTNNQINYGSNEMGHYTDQSRGFRFYNSNVVTMTLSAGNRVAIGGTNPVAKFEVTGSGTSTGATAHFLNSANTSLMLVRDDGNVGMGVTNPPVRLAIGSVASKETLVISSSNPAYNLSMYAQASAADSFALEFGGGPFIKGYNNGNLLDFVWNYGFNFRQNTSNPPWVTINNGGLGVGGTYPTSRLEVTGSGATSSTSAMHVLNSSNVSLMFVKNDGQIGFGTTSSSSSVLTAQSTSAIWAGLTMRNSAGSLGGSIGLDAVGSGGGSTSMSVTAASTLTFGSNNTPGAQLDTNRDFVPYTDLLGSLGSTTKRWRNVYANNISGSLTGSNVSAGQVVVAGTGGVLSGSNNFVWDNTNIRVGIGTNSASTKLHIGNGSYAGASVDGIRLVNGSDSYISTSDGTRTLLMGTNGSQVLVGSLTNHNLILKTNNADAITIDTSQRVGIGTAAPGYKLTIADTTASDFTGLFIANYRAYGVGQGSYGSSLWLGKIESGGNQPMAAVTGRPESETNSTEGQFAISTRASGVLVERLRISSTGYVGIGTFSYTARLLVSGSSTGSDATLLVRHGVAQGSNLPVLDVQNSAGTSLFFVSGSGRVGINTNNPSTRLHVVGSSILANNTQIDPDDYTNSVVAGSIIDTGWSLSTAIGGNSGTGNSWSIGHNGNNMYFGIQNGAAANTMSTYMQVSPSRKVGLFSSVGIGTTDPAYTLDVVGQVKTRLLIGTSDQTGIIIGNNGSEQAQILFTASDNSARFKIQTSGNNTANERISIFAGPLGQVATTETLVVGGNGSVGIGTTNTDGNRLAVNGDMAITGSILPHGDNARNLGSPAKRWANVYAQNISGSLTGSNLTAGQVVVAGTGGLLSGSNNFWWNNSNNRVGIGSSSPSDTLDVNGSINIALGSTYKVGSSGVLDAPGNYTRVISPGTNQSTQGTQILAGTGTVLATFASNGNVGIGTTNTNGSKVAITDGVLPYAIGDGDFIQLKRNASNGAGNDLSARAGIVFGNNSNAFSMFYGGTSDRFRFIDGSGTREVMSLVNGGNVGVGVTNPSAKLQVSGSGGDIANIGGYTINESYVYIGNGSGPFGVVGAYRGDRGATASLALQSAGGSVGIGTSNPHSQLSNTNTTDGISAANSSGFAWRSTANDWASVIISRPSSGVSYGLRVHAGGTTSSDYPLWVSSGAGTGTILAVIRGDGNVGIGTTAASTFATSRSLVIGQSAVTEQNALKVFGGDNANRSPVISLFRTGNTEGIIAQTAGFMALGNGGGIASYTDAALQAYTALYISTAGNVGIGYSSSIGARLQITGSSTGTTPTLVVKHGIANGSSLPILDVQDSAGASHLFVSGSGNVGIGSSQPAFKLDVNGPIRASLMYDLQNTSYYVDPASTSVLSLVNAEGIYDSAVRRFVNPGGGSLTTTTATVAGALKIRLPASRNNSSTMLILTIKIYEYTTGRTQEYRIGGYNYALGNWYNWFAYNLTDTGPNYSVRFGYDGTSDCIWIGETGTNWSYPQVYLTEVLTGYGGFSADWSTGWSLSWATTFDTVEQGPYTPNRFWGSSNLASPITGSGTQNYIPKFSLSTTLTNSQIFDNGTNVGIGTTDFSYTVSDNTPLVGSFTNNRLYVNGSIQLNGNNDAIVFGRGLSTFLKDEEIGFGWGSGWYQIDSTWLRVRNNASIRSDVGGAYIQGNVSIGSSDTNGNKLSVNGEMAITGSIIPHGDNARDLGSASKRWRGVFAASGSFSTLVTTAATTSGSYSRTFASGESGRLTATITSLQNENKTVTFNVTHGAVLFDISFVASVSGFSVSKKFTVASSYDQPPVSFKLVDTGPYTGYDITVSFSKSTSVTTCTFSHNYSPSASIAITIDVAATSSGISGTTVTIFP